MQSIEHTHCPPEWEARDRAADLEEQRIAHEAAELVFAARHSCKGEVAVLRYLVDHRDDDVACRAMEMVLDDIRMVGRGA